MRGRFLACVVAALFAPTGITLLASAGCDNTVIVPGSDGGGGEAGGGIGLIPNGGNGGEDGGAHDALDEFVDEDCKDKPPPIEDYQCDPEHQHNGDCFQGEGCYIYVDYPEDPCGQEIYGSLCLPEGPGGQGDPCGSAQDCGGGLVCVVTGSGTQCVVMCDLESGGDCPSGFVCEPIDVDGFGGCL